jgi:hypothetical protein
MPTRYIGFGKEIGDKGMALLCEFVNFWDGGGRLVDVVQGLYWWQKIDAGRVLQGPYR